jgi:sterol desaturase/sphingolipid hydroxylase (fatty acid hydroxylase superfamily)/protein-S-isoprenylcysteine O-methyltransferase Ste14
MPARQGGKSPARQTTPTSTIVSQPATLLFLISAMLPAHNPPKHGYPQGKTLDYTAVFILACIFVPLERLFPLHEDQPTLRRDWANDLLYVLLNGFLIRAGFTIVAAGFMASFAYLFGPDPTPWIGELPFWAQVLGAMIVADIGYYTAHRICHAVPFLWKFHAVHHSIEEMDWLASHRIHPMDMIFTNTFALLPLWCLGFSLEALILHQAIYQAHTLLLHANIKLNFGPLKWIIASPEYHHWHHANERDAYDRNFAGQFSLIDVILGTAFLPFKRQPKAYGLTEPMPRNYPMQLLYPFHAIARMIARRTRTEPSMSKTESTNPAEDKLGKFAMLMIFGFFAYMQAGAIHHLITFRDQIPLWGLALTSQLVSAAFLAFILYFTITRLPPKSSAAGIMPRLIAMAGTFVMCLLIVMPPDAISPAMRVFATVLTIAGSLMSIYCLIQLGRSFSIMATSRALKTKGAYAIVRHPLYAAEVMMIVGVVLAHGTTFAFAVGALWLVLQVRRAQYEESVLRETFPEYADYARLVPMLIPGLRLAWLEATVEPKAQEA